MSPFIPKTFALIHENKGRALWSLGRVEEALHMFGECLRSVARGLPATDARRVQPGNEKCLGPYNELSKGLSQQ